MLENKELVSKLVRIACKQIDACETFKQPRYKDFKKIEDIYLNKNPKQLKNRFNLPLPILSGFVDTLKSKIDDAPIINYKPSEEADYKAAKKVQAVWDREKSDDLGMWEFIDRQVKTLAIFQGRGTYKIYTDNINGFKSHLEFVDMYDFIFEPQGGVKLDNHIFTGQSNIFKTKYELMQGMKDGYYDRASVRNLVLTYSEDAKMTKEVKTTNNDKYNRFRALGLDPVTNNYVGDVVVNLNEHIMRYNGVNYYLLFDKATLNCIRCEKLVDMIGDDRTPYVSWATHEDPGNFMSKAAVDDIYPIADGMKTIFNQAMDNIQKRNWGQRAYDRTMFPNPKELEWKPDGLVSVNTQGKALSSGVYTFETPDNTQVTVNMIEWLDNLLGNKSGITASAQGASDKDTKVGVYYGDMQQVADRLGLYNKSYKEAWAQLGKRFVGGCKDNLTEPYAIKIIGDNGVEWDELKNNEITEFDIDVSGGGVEIQLNEIKRVKQAEAISSIIKNPELFMKINPNWIIEKILSGADYDEEEIKRAVDNQNQGNQELMSEAAESIQEILKGKMPELNRGATTGFVQKIKDFAIDKLDNEKDIEKYEMMMNYAMAHLPIVQENMKKRAIAMRVARAEQMNAVPQMAGGLGQINASEMPEAIPQGTEGGTAQRSQMATKNNMPI